MKKRFFQLLIALIALLIMVSPALAQTYAFSLDKETVHVYFQEDGTLSLAYEFTFTNATYADPLDFVDVGMPNSNYSLSQAYADINGTPISHIEYSPYVTNGIELGLGSNAIPPGSSGTVHFQIDGIRDVLYVEATDDNYASAVFSPTWFGSEYVSGSTDLTVAFHLPPGIKPDEPRYHQSPSGGWPDAPLTGPDDAGRVIYIWRNSSANGYTQYLFGASFPSNYVPASTITKPTIWQRLGIDPEAVLGFSIVCGVFLVILAIPVMAIRADRKRKLKYLPPKIAIEGHGIKRGLTAIESAILLEQPMDKILTMILFAVIKKGAASVTKKDPLALDFTEPQPEKLRGYEVEFLKAMKEASKAKRRKALQAAMVKLVRSVARKMKGFSKRETSKYYKNIIERAWAQVEAADTPEMRSEKYDDVMEWTMLDKDYDDRTRDVFRHHPVFIPHWWGRYDPGHGRASTPSKIPSPTSRGTPGSAGLPNLPGSDFAASVVNGVQNFSAGVIGSVTDFTSGVTKTTNPPPKPSASSYRSGGGGGSSCACACACAGCACACAGGGR